MAKEVDPFDNLLTLEEKFYREGHELGVVDGDRAGLIEGRIFGLEKGFEKYAAMGRLHGRAAVWAGRLPENEGRSNEMDEKKSENSEVLRKLALQDAGGGITQNLRHAPSLAMNPRLEAHVRTLYALTELGSISTENNEDSVADFDDRLKRAEGKYKVVENITGENDHGNASRGAKSRKNGIPPKDGPKQKGDGSIEDISGLHARH